MATCHDCLHHAACATFADGKDWEQIWITCGQNGQCEDFKDKSLFVEVVRCKDCRYCQQDSNGLWCFNNYEQDLQPDDFCSYGERCNNE